MIFRITIIKHNPECFVMENVKGILSMKNEDKQLVINNIEKLANYNGGIVAAQKENIILSTFHPELTEDLSFHKYFLNYCSSFGPFATKSG